MINQPRTVLLVANTRALGEPLREMLQGYGEAVREVGTVAEANRMLANQPEPPLVFCESELPDGTYRDVLRLVGSPRGKTQVVVLSRLGETGEYLQAMEWGAFDYLAPPLRPGELEYLLARSGVAALRKPPARAEVGPKRLRKIS